MLAVNQCRVNQEMIVEINGVSENGGIQVKSLICK